MYPPYSTRFIAAAGVTNPVEYIVPAGQVAVVRHADFYWGGGLDQASVFVTGSQRQTFAFHLFNPTDASSGSWEGHQVLYPGEILVAYADQPIDVTISGYLLVQNPPPFPP